MNHEHTDTTGATDRDWRLQLLQRVRMIVVGVLMVASLLILALAETVPLKSSGVLIGVVGVITFFAAGPSQSYRVRSWMVVGTLYLLVVSAFYFYGFNPGQVLGAAFCFVAAALLLGQRVMVTMLVVTAAVLVLGFLLLLIDMWSGPAGAALAVSEPGVWLRMTVFSMLFWIAIASSVLFVVNTVEGSVARWKQEVAQRRIAEERKRQAEDVAHRAQKLEAVGQLAAGVAHDFNNALLVIQGWASMLRSEDSPKFRSEAIDAIESATAQAAHLSHQLLAFGQ